MSLCYVCNKFVDKEKHVCEQAKNLIAKSKGPMEVYIHGNALPSRRYNNVTL